MQQEHDARKQFSRYLLELLELLAFLRFSVGPDGSRSSNMLPASNLLADRGWVTKSILIA